MTRPALLVVAALAQVLVLASPAEAGTLYADLGGTPGIDRIVSQAVAVLRTDARIGAYLARSDVAAMHRAVVAQLCRLAGGSCEYDGPSMSTWPKGLHVSTADFNAFAEDIQEAMEQLNISYATQNRLLALLAPMHRALAAQ